jgi:cytosine permease
LAIIVVLRHNASMNFAQKIRRIIYSWLTFLSAAIPPIGGVIIADYLLNHRRYADFSKAQFISVNWIAILSVALGIAAGHYIPGIVPVNAVLGGVFSYILLNPLFNRSLAKSPEVSHAE